MTLAFLVSFSMMACNGITEKTTDLAGNLLTSPTPSVSCSYFSEYDSLSACQTSTLANCTWETQVFPTGGIGVCYKPVTGWESCATTATDWIYTTWTLSCRESGTLYHVARSAISCSSAVCTCANPQVIQAVCNDGVDCPVSIPIPSPTPNCP